MTRKMEEKDDEEEEEEDLSPRFDTPPRRVLAISSLCPMLDPYSASAAPDLSESPLSESSSSSLASMSSLPLFISTAEISLSSPSNFRPKSRFTGD
jgi:hypothetical protein